MTLRSHWQSPPLFLLLLVCSCQERTNASISESPDPTLKPEITQVETFPEAMLRLPTATHFELLRSQRKFPTQGTESADSAASCTELLAAINVQRGKRAEHYWIALALEATLEDGASSSGTLYTSTGRSFTFGSGKARLQSTLAGPIPDKRPERTHVKAFSFEVHDAHLRLGLHRLHEFFDAAHRFRAQFPQTQPLSYTIRSTPFEASTDLFPEHVLDAADLSEASERAFVGAIPAMTEFFRIVYETDGLKDILVSLLPKSKLIKLLLPFSDTQVHFQYGSPPPFRADASELQLGLQQVGVVPVVLSIGDDPMLHLTLYTTDPSYEWQACAGIVAVAIQSATHPDRQCYIRVFPAPLILGRLADDGQANTHAQKPDTLPNIR